MNKIVATIIFLGIFLLNPLAFAKEKAPSLETLYGKGLYNVPTVVRIQFQSQTNKVWYDVPEEERREFLIQWEQGGKKAAEAKKTYAKGLSDKEKRILAAKKERLSKEKARSKVQTAKLKAAAAEKRARDKKSQALRRKVAQARERLRRIQAQRNRNHRR